MAQQKMYSPQKWVHSIVMLGAKLRSTCFIYKTITSGKGEGLDVYKLMKPLQTRSYPKEKERLGVRMYEHSRMQ